MFQAFTPATMEAIESHDNNLNYNKIESLIADQF